MPVNMSAYRAASPGLTVSLNAMKHAFQLGAREDGLDIDKFALVPTGVSQTVEQLDSGAAGFMIPSTPEPEPFVPPGPPLALKSKKYLGGVYSKSQVANFGAYFNHVTPENAGKWGQIEASRDVMEWHELDKAHAMAKQALDPLPFRMHVLVWGNQQPAWIEQLSPAEQRDEIEEWFVAVAHRYGAGLDYVEVVNEPLHDPPNESGNGGGNYLNALGGSGKTGWDWVLNAFRLAREHFPHSKLMINEYNVVNSEDVLVRYMQLVQLLVSEDLLDVIGIQGHAFSTGVSAAQLTASLDSLAQLGLPIVVSELDVESKDAESQLTEYKRIFPIFWEHPAVEGIVLWGYRPGMWRGPQGAILAHENGAERPALKWLREYLRADDGVLPTRDRPSND